MISPAYLAQLIWNAKARAAASQEPQPATDQPAASEYARAA